MKEMPDNRVSKMGFNPSQNRISWITVLRISIDA
jgi:hypothetical protein